MARKTIYIKPDKEELYEKALKYSNEKSLSAIIEKAVEKIVSEKEKYLRDALLIKVLKRTGAPRIFFELVTIAKRSIPEEVLKEADYILDVYEFKKIFDRLNGNWKGPETGFEGHRSMVFERAFYEDDIGWLDEMYSIATSDTFKKYKDEYTEEIKNDLLRMKEDIGNEKFAKIIEQSYKNYERSINEN